MKRRLALLLVACMVLQPLAGIRVRAAGADVSMGIDMVAENAGDGESGPVSEQNNDMDTGTGQSAEPAPQPETTQSETTPQPETPPVSENNEPPTEDQTQPASETETEPQTTATEAETQAPVTETETEAQTPPADGQNGQPGTDTEVQAPTDAEQTEGETPGAADVTETQPASETETETEAETEAKIMPIATRMTGNGVLEVKVVSALPFAVPAGTVTNVTVAVGEQTQNVQLSEQNRSQTVKFEVSPAFHRVRLISDKFAVYEQTVNVGAYQTVKMEVATGEKSLETLATSAQVGQMLLGDVTGDGGITDEDVSRILDELHKNGNDLACDVTFDGKVDVADLQYAVQNKDKKPVEASLDIQTIPHSASLGEGTQVAGGSMDELLSGAGGAQLQPAEANKPVSADNPVEVTFDLNEGGGTELGGMTIQAPAGGDGGESNISNATIDVICQDADGNEYIGRIQVGGKDVARAPMFFMTLSAGTGVLTAEGDGDTASEDNSGEPAPADTAAQQPASEEPADTAAQQPASEEPADTAAQQPATIESTGNGIGLPKVIDLGGQKEAEKELPVVTWGSSQVEVEPDGSLVLDFGSQVAVKRVTIKITGTRKTDKLVDIAKVEFVNDMEKRIPEPELNRPDILNAVGSNEEIYVEWSEQTNVTGYEVYISGPVKKASGTQEQTVRVAQTSQTFVSINDKSLINFQNYTIRVRSVNGEWSSPWSADAVVTPQPADKPAAVDNVVATGGYRSIRVTWKDMDDANGYMVYYKRLPSEGAAGDENFQPVTANFTEVPEGTGKLDTVGYTITGLPDETEYELYVVGWNEKGWGVPSLHAIAETQSSQPPQLPKYKLINESNGSGKLTAHIESAICGDHGGQGMVESSLDAEKSGEKPTFNGQALPNSQWALGVVDDDYGSYWHKENEWDDGVHYPVGLTKGLTVTFDTEYRMNYLTFTAADLMGNIELARVTYWNSGDASAGAVVGSTVIRKMDENGNPFFIVKFHEPIVAKSIQLCIARSYTARIEMKVAEIHFHKCDEDDLYDGIMNLYADDMHTVLREGVTEETIQEWEAKLEQTDHGERHPLYDSLKLELQAARELLKWQKEETIAVDNRITAQKDGHLGFGGLNAWQPLGRSAAEGDTLVVYVGHNLKTFGDNTDLRLIYTQYHAESNRLMSTSSPLKVGRNELTVPKISQQAGVEHGGQLYIAYTGNNAADKYGVRVNGGVKIPMLNIYQKTGEEKKAAIQAYVAELEQYVNGLNDLHTKEHAGSENKNVNQCAYDPENCVLNATDIMMEHMMYSVPATQVWAGLSGASDKAAQLETALDAMEAAMKLFYQHKGLSNAQGAGSKNALPSQHLNIRYMRMFAGAFMYASGNHIGVGYPETRMASSASSMASFGWGIGHEIGHDINQSVYAIAEITNNYFAQLLTIDENHSNTRFDYEKVYKKVTSGAIGRDANGATQLALYWQLHLAFDTNKDDKATYDDYKTQFDNLFFARVDTYARDPGAAPQKGLTLSGGVDQVLMRLSCAAANENMLPFFQRWGMVPDADTIAYAALYGEPTEKAYYYVNDDARDYRADHPQDADGIRGQDIAHATVSSDSNRVVLDITSDVQTGLILGYEIIRSIYADGVPTSEVVGFQLANADGSAQFIDTVSSIDNRVMAYEVRAVDQYLNYSNPAKAGETKISTGGALAKSGWTVETTMTSADDTVIEPNMDDPDSDYYDPNGSYTERKVHSIDRVIDDKRSPEGEAYSGSAADGAEIVIDMHKEAGITSLRYTGGAIPSVNVYVGPDGENWTSVKKNYTGLANGSSEPATIWFDSVLEEHRESWIGTYNARYVKLEISGAESVQIEEIDICGPSGDNIEFEVVDGRPMVGRLSRECVYGKEPEDVIPEGSLIFTGRYRGNPAYNVVMLFDTEGNVVGALDGQVNAEQVIFADVPEQGNLGTTSDGIWVYYVRPENWTAESVKALKGVRAELYRVDDAKTLAGERVVSDTTVITIPETLPDIELTNLKVPEGM